MKKVYFIIALVSLLLGYQQSNSTTLHAIVWGTYIGLIDLPEGRKEADCEGNDGICIDRTGTFETGKGAMFFRDHLDQSIGIGFTDITVISVTEPTQTEPGGAVFEETETTQTYNTYQDWLNALPE